MRRSLRCTQELQRLQEEALFHDEYDSGDAVVTVVGGTGGTDAQDWAEIVLRMYLRWAAARGFETELLEASPGEEAGLKSATFTVRGENAYGTLKAERGVHRLVRLSPFDQAHRRHTSFAQVIVSPLLDDEAEVEIDESEIRVDTYRASGAGGQHVNKTDSAVRITHLPIGDRRSVPERALADLEPSDGAPHPPVAACRARAGKREAELARERGEVQDTGFGSQIRSYVLHPYQQVKDHRTQLRDRETRRACSTVISTASSTRISSPARPAGCARGRRGFGYTSASASAGVWRRRRACSCAGAELPIRSGRGGRRAGRRRLAGCRAPPRWSSSRA